MATNSLDAVLSQYEKAQQTGNFTPKMSQEDRMKRYFAAILGDNEKQGQKRLRILPTADGSSPFVEAMFHEMLIDGKYIKLYDPAMDNERSPLNEVYEELLIEGDKKLASEYKSRKFYIVKVIDRDNEQDGPKFWRFKHNYKNEGILDKIIPIWRNKGDVTDSEKGRDLILELTKAKTPKGKEYTVIQTIMYDDPAPLHEDEETKKTWANDELTWRDVYSKKPVEYLEAIARGETPKWSTELGKYTYGDSTESVESFGGTKAKTEVYADPQVNDEIDEDLPF
jgi:hypothetical protein